MVLLLLLLLLSKVSAISLKLLFLGLETLLLLQVLAFCLFLGFLLLPVVVDELVGQETGTNGQETSNGSSTNIGCKFLVLDRLDALLVDLRNMRSALHRGSSLASEGSVLAGNVVGSQSEVQFSGRLTSRGIDVKYAVHSATRGMDDLVDGNSRKGNNGVGGGLLVHDFDKQLRLTGERH